MAESPRGKTFHQSFALVGWVLLCLAAELSGVAFLPGRWYAHLQKAAWTPPSYLFAPIWTVIYFLMAVAAWLVWKRGGFRAHRLALELFVVQLLFNAAWSFFCFHLHNLGLSVLDMLLLWVLVGITTWRFFKINRTAGVLMSVYLAWITFAASLNVALWRLNS